MTVLVGIFVIDAIGFVWLKFVTGISWKSAMLAGFVAFVPLDVVKCVVASVIVKPLQRALGIIEIV